jgi:FKBP-type peptidyl-prolyl cis-trans isomerase
MSRRRSGLILLVTLAAVLPLLGLAGCGGDDSTGPTELLVEDIVVGTGATAAAADMLTVHYVGRLLDGTQFDSSYARGQPYSFRLGAGQVIKGWDQGVPGMKVGGQRRLTIPPSLGYGSQGTGPIPPNATLVFEIELLAIAGK